MKFASLCLMLFAELCNAQEAVWSVDFEGGKKFTKPTEVVEIKFERKLDGIKAMTVGGWFYSQRSGEQVFLSRGLPEVGANGERVFRREQKWVNFCLGTDQHGFLMGTINGNGTMPFVFVTL